MFSFLWLNQYHHGETEDSNSDWRRPQMRYDRVELMFLTEWTNMDISCTNTPEQSIRLRLRSFWRKRWGHTMVSDQQMLWGVPQVVGVVCWSLNLCVFCASCWLNPHNNNSCRLWEQSIWVHVSLCYVLGQVVRRGWITSGNLETVRCISTISLQLHWHFNDTSSSVHLIIRLQRTISYTGQKCFSSGWWCITKIRNDVTDVSWGKNNKSHRLVTWLRSMCCQTQATPIKHSGDSFTLFIPAELEPRRKERSERNGEKSLVCV